MKKNRLIMVGAAALLLTACGTGTGNPKSDVSESRAADTDTQMTENSEISDDASVSDDSIASTDTDDADTIETENTESADGVSERSGQQFVNMNIDLEHGTIKILSGDEFSFLYADGKTADYTISDDTLYIQAHKEKDLVLTLPDDDTYNTVIISVEEGNIFAEQIPAAKKLELDVENGEVDLDKITVSESAKIEAEQSTVLLYGTLTGNVDAQCEEAHLNMEITGMQTAYNYSLTISDAKIRIGDDNYHTKGSETVDNGAEYTMKLSCTQGDVDVDFVD